MGGESESAEVQGIDLGQFWALIDPSDEFLGPQLTRSLGFRNWRPLCWEWVFASSSRLCVLAQNLFEKF